MYKTYTPQPDLYSTYHQSIQLQLLTSTSVLNRRYGRNEIYIYLKEAIWVEESVLKRGYGLEKLAECFKEGCMDLER